MDAMEIYANIKLGIKRKCIENAIKTKHYIYLTAH